MQLPDPTTLEEYLRLDDELEEPVEYLAGETYVMSGASFRHQQIVARAIRSLAEAMPGCHVVPSQRVRVENTHHDHVYPDIVVVCDEPRFYGEDARSLLNPSLLVEVTSPSTERRDRDWKLEVYTQIPSLEQYWIMAQDEVRLMQFIRHRGAEPWRVGGIFAAGSVIDGTRINVDELYP